MRTLCTKHVELGSFPLKPLFGCVKIICIQFTPYKIKSAVVRCYRAGAAAKVRV